MSRSADLDSTGIAGRAYQQHAACRDVTSQALGLVDAKRTRNTHLINTTSIGRS